jgi:uncharacterized phage-associated protein
MKNDQIISALDVTNWFYQKASNKIISERKIQHLLFLSQLHFALKYGKLLMPSLFICADSGFYNADIKSIMKFGLPLMGKSNFTSSISDFLNLIWQKYGSQTDDQLDKFIFSLEEWKHHYRPEKDTIVNPIDFVDSFANTIQNSKEKTSSNKTKVMMSQNGPVKVSSWQPRKLKSSNV